MIMAVMLFLNHYHTNSYNDNVYAVRALYTRLVTVLTFCTRQIIDSLNPAMHICSSVIKKQSAQKNI